jgi:hypothetical protein
MASTTRRSKSEGLVDVYFAAVPGLIVDWESGVHLVAISSQGAPGPNFAKLPVLIPAR